MSEVAMYGLAQLVRLLEEKESIQDGLNALLLHDGGPRSAGYDPFTVERIGTHQPVKAIFWPWLEPFTVRT